MWGLSRGGRENPLQKYSRIIWDAQVTYRSLKRIEAFILSKNIEAKPRKISISHWRFNLSRIVFASVDIAGVSTTSKPWELKNEGSISYYYLK